MIFGLQIGEFDMMEIKMKAPWKPRSMMMNLMKLGLAFKRRL